MGPSFYGDLYSSPSYAGITAIIQAIFMLQLILNERKIYKSIKFSQKMILGNETVIDGGKFTELNEKRIDESLRRILRIKMKHLV